MANLFGIGLSGLNAAQAGLSTTSNNISNVNTPGYTRRHAQLAENVASSGGNGVDVTGVKRDYAKFLSAQLDAAQSKASATSTHLDQISQLDNLLGDPKAGLAPLIDDFFAGAQTVAGDPSDTAARASLLGNARGLAGQFQSFASTLDGLGSAADSQIKSAVGQVNSVSRQIAGLNRQIIRARGQTGSPPNNLLDKRDALVSQLGKLVNVSVSENDNASVNVVVGGHALVDATGSHALTTTTAADDAAREVIAYKTADGSLSPLSDSRISGGKIGGLLAFRGDSLAPAKLRLNQLAHVFAAKVNEVQGQGTDLNAKTGTDLFAISQPISQANDDNQGNATLGVTFAGKTSDIRASNYRVTYTDKGYQATRLSDGKGVASGPNLPLSFDGLTVSANDNATLAKGDSFLVKPLANAAADFDVNISDPARIAAAGASGKPGDNSNALALTDLQNAQVVENNRSFNSDYAQFVGDIGNKTNALRVASDSEQALTQELTSAQQSVSGVNLDEENVNLLYYQRLYQANAKVIQTASTLFDTLLGIQ